MQVFYDMIQALLICMHYTMKDFMNQGCFRINYQSVFMKIEALDWSTSFMKEWHDLGTSDWSNSYYEKTHDLDAFN